MLRNAMAVMDLFSEARREIGVTEAAALLGRPKSTISRWLADMEDAGFLERDGPTGRYRLGMRLAALGQLARRSTTLQQLARPHLEALAARTGETANLVVLSGGSAVNVELVESPRPIKHVGWLGRRLPLHATAAGKALLAWLDAAEIRGHLSRPLAGYTDATLTTVSALTSELERTRERGWALAWGELEPDLAGVGAPVRDHTGRVVGAITISAPLARTPRETIADPAAHVVAAADALSHSLGAPVRPAPRHAPAAGRAR